MTQWITVINRANVLALVGQAYLFPGESRVVPLPVFLEALKTNPGLVAPDVATAAPAVPDEERGRDSEGRPQLAEVENLNNLNELKKADLIEMAEARGVDPGRMTKAALIDALTAAAEDSDRDNAL